MIHPLKFDWTVRTLKEWQELLARTCAANWMQTWAYAESNLQRTWIPTRMATLTRSEKIVAIVAVQKIKLGPFKFISIQRGPLWLDKNPSEDEYLEVAYALRHEFPPSLFTWLRWLPEFEFSKRGYAALENIHFKLGQHNFQTLWIDLTLDLLNIRKNLKQKWRNSLNKFEKSNTSIQANTAIAPFLNFYELYKLQKKYKGPSTRFLKTEFREAQKQNELLLLWALKDGVPCAGMAFHLHGKVVSYRASWNSTVGRNTCAHYGLLWRAIEIFKEQGFEKMDLGGILPDEAPHLSHFKFGLNGTPTRYEFLKG